MLRRCGAASSGGYLATLWLFLWSQSAASVMFDLHVGSSVLGRLVGLGGLVRFSLLSVIVVLLVLWSFVFVGLSSIFSLLLVLCVLVHVNSCLASIKLCL